MPSVQASVGMDKEKHPERYCPERRCLWRTDGPYCPRHGGEARTLNIKLTKEAS